MFSCSKNVTARRQPSASQGQRPQKKQTCQHRDLGFSLQNCKEVDFCYEATQSEFCNSSLLRRRGARTSERGLLPCWRRLDSLRPFAVTDTAGSVALCMRRSLYIQLCVGENFNSDGTDVGIIISPTTRDEGVAPPTPFAHRMFPIWGCCTHVQVFYGHVFPFLWGK